MKSKNRLVFLGTGSAANTDRQMTSLLFQFGDDAFLIDCGDGAGSVRQLLSVGVRPEQISCIFITHKHRDHILGIPALLSHSILFGNAKIIKVYGPQQAIDIVSGFTFATHEYSIEQKKRIQFIPLEENNKIIPFKNQDIQVFSNLLIHQQSVHTLPCLSYRIDAGHKSVGFSGDMHPDSSFDMLVKGVDILVHEVLDTSDKEEFIHSVKHSSSKDAGIAAQRANAKLLIITHIAPLEIVNNLNQLVLEAKNYFTGEVIVADDLMEIALE